MGIIQCLAADLQMCTGSHTPLAQQVGCATRLPSSQAEVRTGRTYPEAVLRSKSRAFADVLRQAPEGQKLAPRKVEQIPARQAGRREVPESQSVDRKGASKRSPTIIMGRSDQPLARGSDASTASRPKPVASMDATWYTGVVRWSRGSMAWLSCEELKARFPDHDVFLHRSECRDTVMPRQRDRMVFRLMVDDGKPKALGARTEAAHQAANESLKMSLEEYHASRSKSGRGGPTELHIFQGRVLCDSGQWTAQMRRLMRFEQRVQSLSPGAGLKNGTGHRLQDYV